MVALLASKSCRYRTLSACHTVLLHSTECRSNINQIGAYKIHETGVTINAAEATSCQQPKLQLKKVIFLFGYIHAMYILHFNSGAFFAVTAHTLIFR